MQKQVVVEVLADPAPIHLKSQVSTFNFTCAWFLRHREQLTMPLIPSGPDALAYIDAPPSGEAFAAANKLIQAELDAEASTSLHPLIPNFRQPRYSDLIEAEHARIASGAPREGGIDLSRYEALDAPEKGDAEAWKSVLQQAYASQEYLTNRNINLSLLETYGKNTWLIGNAQLEDILRDLEREVEAVKIDLEAVEQARRAMQSNVEGEMKGLEEWWRKGVGRLIETQAAAERLRLEVLERKRNGVS